MGGFGRHQPDISHAGAGILGHHVLATQAIDEAAHGLDQRRALVVARVADDHAFAAALRQPGQGRLVGHAARQPQHIGEGLGVGGVGPHAAAAQALAEAGAVHGDDAAAPRVLQQSGPAVQQCLHVAVVAHA